MSRPARGRRRAAALVVGLGTVAALGAVAEYADGPPAGHTGGFGEPTCWRCHNDSPPNDPPGTLDLDGVPSAYVPATSYRLNVILSRPGMRRSGFQVSARVADGPARGKQAGHFRPLDPAVRLAAGPSDIEYAQHATALTVTDSSSRTRWSVEWTAPARAMGPVVFHAAANAANDDDSEFGDHIYTGTWMVPQANAR